MRYIERRSPAVTAVYFIAVTLVSAMCVDGVIACISLLGAVLLCGVFRVPAKRLALVGAVIMLSAAVNAITSHNGKTVLFVLNDNPITLEAVLYGAVMGVTISAVLCWFTVFSRVMTEDKLLYVMGLMWPKLALVLSMALRSVPLYGRQMRRISDSQRVLGLYRDESAVDRIRGGTRVFSALVTWALENGIITADSMSARGYGVGRRTSYALYSFTAPDGIALAVILLLTGVVAAGIAVGGLGFDFYPSLTVSSHKMSIFFYCAYFALAAMPSVAELSEELRWKYLRSKI